MTGYTVHTGSTEKFSDGWDQIFRKKKTAKKTTAKSTKKSTGKKSKKTTTKKRGK